MWYRRRWILFGHEINLEIKEAPAYLIRKSWKSIGELEEQLQRPKSIRVYGFLEHILEFPDQYTFGKEIKELLDKTKKGKVMNDQINTEMALEAIPADLLKVDAEGNPIPVTVQTTEDRGDQDQPLN